MKVLGPSMPVISETERTALDAGVTWIETISFLANQILKN